MKLLYRLCLAIFIVCTASAGILYFYKDELPDRRYILNNLYQNPVQTETFAKPFNLVRGGEVYTIKPLYEYEIYGLVVSYHHSDSLFDYYHDRWNDHLNTKDVCVVWGNNIKTQIYKDMKFKSGSFTCYPAFKSDISRGRYSLFSGSNLSNNHLLSASRNIDNKVMNIETGDQIFIKGYLVNYGHKGEKNFRTTSTS